MKDNIQNQENERSPLLPTIQHNSSSSTAPFLLSNTPTYSDSQPLAGYSSTQLEYVKEESFSRPLKIVLLSFILVSFIIFNLHQIVIPHRIQQQINSNQGLTINSITIHPFTASNSITLTVKGERRVAIHPPTTITLSKTRLDILAISTKLNKPRIVHSIQNGLVNWFGFGLKEWTGEDAYYAKSQILGHFSIPDQVTPTDVDAVRLDFESAFKIYAKGVRRVMLDLKSVELIRMQGIANILFENIGNYRIPMWSTIQIQGSISCVLSSLMINWTQFYSLSFHQLFKY